MAQHRRPSAPSVAAPSTPPSASAAAAATPTPEPTPVPSPESELIVYNWLDYIGEDVIPSFEEKYPVKVKYELFDDIEVAYAKLGQDGAGYDISFPISVDVPRFVAAGTLIELDQSLLPNLVNLGPQWTDPGYDPGNKHSVPYVWWTTGVGYDSTKVTDSPTSSKALWDPRYKGHISMMDDYAEAFGLTLIQLGYSANTTDTTQLDEALALLKEQKPLLRTYSNDTVGTMLGGDVWIGMIWGSDLYQIQSDPAGKNIVYYIPEEGGVRGSDTDGDLFRRKAPDRRSPVPQPPARRPGQRLEHQLHRLHGTERGGQGIHHPGDPGRSGGQPRQGDPRQARRAARPAERRRRGVPVALAGAQGRRLNATPGAADPSATPGGADPRTGHDRRAPRDRVAGDLLPAAARVHPGRQPGVA